MRVPADEEPVKLIKPQNGGTMKLKKLAVVALNDNKAI